VGRVDLGFGVALEGQHDAVAGARRLLIVRWTDIGVMAVLALGAVADPAAVGEFALVAQRAQDRIVEFARRLAVERADGDVTIMKPPETAC